MGGTTDLAFRAVFHKSEACGLQPVSQVPAKQPGRLRIYVLFTEMRETVVALESAVALSAGLPSEITLIVPVLVPYPLPLEEPPVSLGFLCRRITQLAAGVTMEIEAFVYLCRDPAITIAEALDRESLVVIGRHKRWLLGRSPSVARKLRQKGHHVVLADCK
jgi:hypothetical protein